MLLAIVLMTFITVFLVVYLFATQFAPVSDRRIQMRLKALDASPDSESGEDPDLAKPFAQRVLSPLTGALAPVFMRLTPTSTKEMTAEWIAAAGGMNGMSAGQFLTICAISGGTLATFTVFLLAATGRPGNVIVGYSIYALTFGILFPFFILRQKVSKRKESMRRDMPDVLDLLTVSIEAGLGFDGALSKLSEKMKGPLVEEFTRALQEMRVGVPRREALRNMSIRCDVTDVSLFVTSIIQADQLGVSIGNVLRVQSAAMRERRRQRAQEQALKAPVKMLIPLVLFIFPTLFIMLLGPAAIDLIDNFMKK